VAVASSDKHIYLFQYQDGDYQKLAACRLENGFPVAVNFSEDSKKVVICTNQRKLLLLDPVTFQLMFRVEDLAQYFWSSFNGRYPLVTKSANSSMVPFALGHNSNIVAAADENGNLHVWKDVESIKENIGLNLVGHASAIHSVLFTNDDKRMVSFGTSDLCVLQWRIAPLE
jgi:WD40 repeat protein